MKRSTQEIVERAGRIRKIVELAASPSMDMVAVKLNSGLTYREKQNAEGWQRAFELAASDEDNIYVLASRYAKGE